MITAEINLDNMEAMIGLQLQANIDHFMIDFETLLNRLVLSGMSEEQIKVLLINDLANGGRIFAQFKNGVERAVSTAVNMASNEASEAVFTKAGITKRKWIAVSYSLGKEPCPDCKPRHQRIETYEYWRIVGTPGSGFSVCRTSCKCRLVPVDYKGELLEKPIIRKRKK